MFEAFSLLCSLLLGTHALCRPCWLLWNTFLGACGSAEMHLSMPVYIQQHVLTILSLPCPLWRPVCSLSGWSSLPACVCLSYIFRKINVGEVVGTMSSTTVGQGSEGKVCPVWKHSCILQYGSGPANALWNVWGHQTLSSKQRHSPRARQLHFRVKICFLVF